MQPNRLNRIEIVFALAMLLLLATGTGRTAPLPRMTRAYALRLA